MFKELVAQTRSIRVYDESVKLTEKDFRELLELVRLAPVGRNHNPCKYVFVTGEEMEKIYPYMRWAAAIPEWPGPAKGERPGSVIFVVTEKESISPLIGIDIGIAAQTILLGAREKGFGGCILRAIDHMKIKEVLGIQEGTVQIAIALGKPGQQVFIEPYEGSDAYWMDEEMNNHVPKRNLESYILSLEK